MKKHWHYIDFLRVLACFLVIANHTVKDSFIGYNMERQGQYHQNAP